MLITKDVKVGDIVWFDSWGGIIGPVKEVSDGNLLIEWPNDSFFPVQAQHFYDGNEEPIEVVVLNTPEDVFKKMSKLFNSWDGQATRPVEIRPNLGKLLAYPGIRGR